MMHPAEGIGQAVIAHIHHQIKVIAADRLLNDLPLPRRNQTAGVFTPDDVRYPSDSRQKRWLSYARFPDPVSIPPDRRPLSLPADSQLFNGISPKGPTGIVSICFLFVQHPCFLHLVSHIRYIQGSAAALPFPPRRLRPLRQEYLYHQRRNMST